MVQPSKKIPSIVNWRVVFIWELQQKILGIHTHFLILKRLKCNYLRVVKLQPWWSILMIWKAILIILTPTNLIYATTNKANSNEDNSNQKSLTCIHSELLPTKVGRPIYWAISFATYFNKINLKRTWQIVPSTKNVFTMSQPTCRFLQMRQLRCNIKDKYRFCKNYDTLQGLLTNRH